MKIIMPLLTLFVLTSCSKPPSDGQTEQAHNTPLSSQASTQAAPLPHSTDKTMTVPDNSEQTMDDLFGLEVLVAADLSIEIIVNGIPYNSKEAGDQSALSLPIHDDVVPGKNVVEILIGKADISPSAPLESILTFPPAQKRLILRLQKDVVSEPEPDTFTSKIENLDEVIWEPEIEEGKIKLPQKLSLEFKAPKSQPSPAWNRGEAKSVDDIQGELTEIYRDIIKALQSGDVEKVSNISKLVFEDAARAYPIGGTVEQRKEDDIDELRYILNAPDATIPDLLKPLECRAYADGRLFECFSPDGKQPIRVISSEEDRSVYFDLKFSEIDGKLQVVRQ